MSKPTIWHTLHRVDCICVTCENIRKAAMTDACGLNDISGRLPHRGISVGGGQYCTDECCECNRYPYEYGPYVRKLTPDERLAQLARDLECAMINMSNAVDIRGLRVMLHYGSPNTTDLGATLRRMSAYTEGIPVMDGVDPRMVRANTAHNCLLVAQAYDAAARYEAVRSGREYVADHMDGDLAGVVFGRAKTHD
jgi:hypothetical protein